MFSVNTSVRNGWPPDYEGGDFFEDRVLREIGAMGDCKIDWANTRPGLFCDPSATLVSLSDLPGNFDYSWTTQSYFLAVEINDESSEITDTLPYLSDSHL